jgi:hypothetical protein
MPPLRNPVRKGTPLQLVLLFAWPFSLALSFVEKLCPFGEEEHVQSHKIFITYAEREFGSCPYLNLRRGALNNGNPSSGKTTSPEQSMFIWQP